MYGTEDVTLSSPFMMNRFLSMTQDFLIAKKTNKYIGRIPSQHLLKIWRCYFAMVDVTNAPYFQYPKKKKLQQEKLLRRVCEAFECNQKHGQQIIEILARQGFKPNELFGLKKNE